MKKNILNTFASSQQNNFIKMLLIGIFLITTICSKVCTAQNTVIDSLREAYFFYAKTYPNQAANNWANDSWAPNGITHDNSNWYICSVHKGADLPCKVDNKNFIIWRIPVTLDLNQDFNNTNTAVIKWELAKFNNPPNASFKNYGHAGDLDHFVHNNVDYLAVPLTGGGSKPIIAFFRASDLHFINYAQLNNLSGQSIGWCAVNPITKKLYTSLDNATTIYCYNINWSVALSSSSSNHNGLTLDNAYTLIPLSGSSLFENMQGGEFSPSGNLLYVSCGLNGSAATTDGIHVFDATGTTLWSEVKRSTNSVFNTNTQGACFDYPFDNGGVLDQEPEGLTIWDLDNMGEQHVKGSQLHVLVDDHNCFGSEENTKVFLHHYKSFKCPYDVTVYATTPNGEPATNPAISFLLNQGTSYAGCATVTRSTTPSVFPCGTTSVTFTVTDNVTNEKVKCTADVNIVAKHDECLNALRIFACDKTITDNYCAAPSHSIPGFSCYSGSVKDVWFVIYPSSYSLSVETFELTSGVSNTVMQAFSGTCGNLHEIACDDSSGDGEHAKITFTNLPNLNPIYIRVTDYGANYYGRFGIYYKKIDPGTNLFADSSFIAGDSSYVHDYPTLTGDVNGDGKTDLIFEGQDWDGGPTNLNIRVKMSNGDGTFSGYVQHLTDLNLVHQHPVLTGDINGDGKTDLIFVFPSSGSGGLTVRTKMSDTLGQFISYEDYLGDGGGVFTYPTLTGDVNGDGKTDLIFVGQNWNGAGLNIRTKMSNGDGTFTAYHQVLGDGSGVLSHPVLTGDVNGDGKTDLIFVFPSSGSGGLTVRTKMSDALGQFISHEDYLGDGSGVFTYPTLTGDVNGDGKTDLIFVGVNWNGPGLNIRTKMSNGDGTFTAYHQVLGDGSGLLTYPVLTGDVNGDGKTDLIFVGQDWKGCGLNIRVKLSNGDGTWCSSWQTLGDGSGVHTYPTLTGDVNGDGKTDVIFEGQNWSSSGLNIRTKFSRIIDCNNVASDENPSIPQFTIFPNPTGDYFSIASDFTTEISVRIFNQTGSLVQDQSNVNTDYLFNVSQFASGIYFVEISVSASGDRVVKKLVKIKQ